MSPLYKLKDYKESFKFEKEFPKELRWDDKYKLYMLQESDSCQGIWFRDKLDLIGEIITTWHSVNVLEIEKLSISPSHQGKGLAHDLVRACIEWAELSNCEMITGKAHKGASWKIFENFGATQILTYKDWAGTKEDYISFKLEI